MIINTFFRKRTLTKINAKISQKGEKSEELCVYSVGLYCCDRGQKYKITTGLTTTNPAMTGMVFTDKDLTQVANAAKTRRLTQIFSDSMQFANDHSQESVEFIKRGIKEIVQGKRDIHKPKYLTDYIMEFAHEGNHSEGTVRNYRYTRDWVAKFDAKATLESVDEDWLNRLVKEMKGTMTTNGYAIPLRNLRAVFNLARKKKKLTKNYPFEDFYIKQSHRRKAVLKAQALADFRDFPCEGWQERYRDYFMLQIYLCGIDIVDLCRLKPSQYRSGRIRFFRQKNECHEDMVEVDLPVCKEAKALIERYHSKGKEYLLDCMDHRADYHSFARSMNKALKKIGYQRIVPDKVGKKRKVEYYPIIPGISTKTSRRTFTTIATRIGVSERLVGMALGHEWSYKNTTQLYEYLDLEDMDNGISKVIRHIGSLQGRAKDVIIEEIKDREGLD